MDDIIDFNTSSVEWRKNKISLKNGYFKYKCEVNNCNNEIYLYTTSHKHFNLFASDFDILNKDNPNKYKYCEDHLLKQISTD